MEQIKSSNLLNSPALNKSATLLFEDNQKTSLMYALFIWATGILVVHMLPLIGIANQTYISMASSTIQLLLGTALSLDIASKVSKKLPAEYQQNVFTVKKAIVMFLIYYGMWLFNHFHIIFIDFGVAKSFITPIISLTMVASLYLIGYYFFFIPYLFKNYSLAESIQSAPKLVSYPRLTAIRIIATGLIISLTFQQFCLFFTAPNILPSSFHKFFEYISIGSGAINWLVTTFMALAVAKNVLEKYSDTSHLEQNNLKWGPLFATKGIGRYIIALLGIGFVSLYLSIMVEPTFTAKITKSSYNSEKKELEIQVQLTDPKNGLSSVQPMFFRIAGQDGFVLSNIPTSISPEDQLKQIIKGANDATIELKFLITSRQDDFEQLKDKALWYVNHKIADF